MSFVSLIVTLALTVVALRAILKTQKTYKKIVENIYTTYTASEDATLTDEQWEDVLKNI